MAYDILREYFSLLKFYNDTYNDLAPGNTWSLNYTSISPMVEYREIDSQFNTTMDLVGYQTITFMNSETSLANSRVIPIDTGCYSLSFYFNISADALERFDKGDPNRYIPGVRWDDNNGKNVKIILLERSTNENTYPCISIEYSGYKKEFVFYDYYQPDHWFHLLYTRKGNLDRIFIDGKIRYESVIDLSKANKNTFKNVTIGNPYKPADSGIWIYSYDEVCITNDYIIDKEFEYPDHWLSHLFVEAQHTEEDVSDEIQERVNAAPWLYNANKSRWDVILDDIPITRPVYWEPKPDEKTLHLISLNKHDFNSRTSAFSNFDFLDKNKIKDD